MKERFADWIERTAARFGYVPEQDRVRGLTELVIFASRDDAERSGFRNDRLPGFDHIRCWYPAAGMRGLAMRPMQRVTIPYHMLNQRTDEGKLVDILRARQRVYGHEAITVVV